MSAPPTSDLGERPVSVARRELHRGRVWRIAAAHHLGTYDGFDVLWHPEANAVYRPFADGRQLRIPGNAPWQLERRAMPEASIGLVRPGDRHSLWLFFRAGAFVNWYVNLERESARNGPCFDYVDEKLDLVVDADGTVHWKDVDELEEAARTGHLDADDVRAQAERILAAPPWPTGWERFEPDPAWPAPELPAGWQAPPLRSERFELLPLGERDLDDYAALRGDPRTRVHSRTRVPLTHEQAQAELERSNASWHEHGFGTWCLRDLDGTFAGVIVAVPGRHQPETPDVGWVLAPDHWGRGLATEAAQLVLADLFERAGVERVTAFLRAENDASRRVAEKLGMTRGETLGGDEAVDRYELRSPG
jgi:RimJ/RimL family protein N-acetyltransferase